MTVYIPATFDDNDWRPSWTGNYGYPTVTIRGIFDSLEKANEAISNWEYRNDYEILEREVNNIPENYEGKILFAIDYYEAYLDIDFTEYGCYELNKVVDEDYSALWDERGYLGVEDY